MKNKALFFLFFCLICYSSLVSAKDALIKIPFSILHNLIVVKATVQGQAGDFLVNTGNEQLLLNEKYFSANRCAAAEKMGFHTELEPTCVRISLGTLGRLSEPAYLTDIGALEQKLGCRIMGILGTRVFRDHELMFDYKRQLMTLYPLDRDGKATSLSAKEEAPLETLPLRKKGALFCVQTTIGGIKMNMVADCGTGASMIALKERSRIMAAVLDERRGSMRTIADGKKAVWGGTVEDMAIGHIIYPEMDMLFPEKLPFRMGKGIDGILGFDFFRQHRLSINFRKREVRIWELQGEAKLETDGLAKN